MPLDRDRLHETTGQPECPPSAARRAGGRVAGLPAAPVACGANGAGERVPRWVAWLLLTPFLLLIPIGIRDIQLPGWTKALVLTGGAALYLGYRWAVPRARRGLVNRIRERSRRRLVRQRARHVPDQAVSLTREPRADRHAERGISRHP